MFVTPSSNVSGQCVVGKRRPVPVNTYSFPLPLFTYSFTRSFDSERILMLDAAFVCISNRTALLHGTAPFRQLPTFWYICVHYDYTACNEASKFTNWGRLN